MNKLTVIINGSGGVGKDTLITEYRSISRKCILNISSIEELKLRAIDLGWNKEKDQKGRKFLSELKRITTEYNDYSMNSCNKFYRYFNSKNCKEEILFLHMREYEEIKRFKEGKENIITVLVDTHRPNVKKTLGNKSDDEVYKYARDYDFIIYNDNLNKAVKDLTLAINSKLK